MFRIISLLALSVLLAACESKESKELRRTSEVIQEINGALSDAIDEKDWGAAAAVGRKLDKLDTRLQNILDGESESSPYENAR